MPWSALAWVSTAMVLGAYITATFTGRWRLLHWANALGWPAIALHTYLLGAFPSFVLTVFFGLVGVVGLLGEPHTPYDPEGVCSETSPERPRDR